MGASKALMEGDIPIGILTPAIREKRKRMVKPYVKGDVLDLGCGQADFYDLCRDQIAAYYGVDGDPAVLERMRQKFPDANFFQKDFDEDTLDLDRKFDCILMIGLVEHLYNQKHIMKEVKRYLKPNGVIVITTPTPFGNDVVHRVGSTLRLFSPVARDDHVVIYNKKRFEILAKDLGFVIEKYKKFQLGCNQLVVLRDGKAVTDSVRN